MLCMCDVVGVAAVLVACSLAVVMAAALTDGRLIRRLVSGRVVVEAQSWRMVACGVVSFRSASQCPCRVSVGVVCRCVAGCSSSRAASGRLQPSRTLLPANGRPIATRANDVTPSKRWAAEARRWRWPPTHSTAATITL